MPPAVPSASIADFPSGDPDQKLARNDIDADEAEMNFYQERLIDADIDSLSKPRRFCVRLQFFFSDLISLRSNYDRPFARHMSRLPCLWGISPNDPTRMAIIRVSDSMLFSFFFALLLAAQVIWLAAAGPSSVGRTGSSYGVDIFFTIMFTLEMCIKIIADGFMFAGPRGYLNNFWNWVDMICNLFGWLKFAFGENYIAIFRMLRLVGPLSSLPVLHSMGTLVRCLVEALSQFFELSLVLLYFFFAFAIAGIQLFSSVLDNRCQNILTGTWEHALQAHNPPHLCSTNSFGRQCDTANNWHCTSYGASPWFNALNFNNFGTALMTVFITVSRDGWSPIMFYVDDTLATASRIYFFLLVIIGNLFLINLVIALITLRFNRARQAELERQRLVKEARDEENRQRIEVLKRQRSSKISQMMTEDDAQALGIRIDGSSSGLGFVGDGGNALDDVTVQTLSPTQRILISRAYQAGVWTITLFVAACLGANQFNATNVRVNLITVAHMMGVIVFGADFIIRITALGPKKFVSSVFNIIDTAALACMLVEFSTSPKDGGATTIFGALAVLRLFRLVEYLHTWGPMQLVFGSILRLFDDLLPVLLCLLFYIYIFAVIGMQQLSQGFSRANLEFLSPLNNPDRRWITFDNFWWSCLSVFQVMTGEDWWKMMYQAIDIRGWLMAPLFIVMYVCGAILLFAVLIAVMLGNFTSVQHALDAEAKKSAELKTRRLEGFPLLLHDIKALLLRACCLKSRAETTTAVDEPTGLDVYRPNKAQDEEFRARYTRKDYGNFSFTFTTVHQVGRDADEDERRRQRAELIAARRNERLNDFDRMDLQGTSCFCLWPAHPVRRRLAQMLHHQLYWVISTLLILLGIVLLAVREPQVAPGSQTKYLMDTGDIFMTAVFLLEFILKIITLGFIGHKDSYLDNAWHRLEFIILLLHITQLFVNFFVTNNEIWRLFQSLLGLRALRVLTAFRPTRNMLLAVITTLPSFFKVALSAFVFYYIYGVLGISLLAGRMRRCQRPDGFVEYFLTQAQCEATGVGQWLNPIQGNFDDIAGALRTLFQLSTVDSWTQLMFLTIDATPSGEPPKVNHNVYMSIPIVIFVFIAAFLFVAMFIALVVFTFMRLFASRKIDTAQEVTKMWLKIYEDIISTSPKRVSQDARGENKQRSYLYFLMTTNSYEYLICFAVLLNTVIMAMQHSGASSTYTLVLDIFNYIFLFGFIIEIGLRIWVMEWRRYWADVYDRADFVLTAIAFVGFILEMVSSDYGGFRPQLLRIAIMLRLARFSKVYKPLQPMVSTISGALSALIFICIVFFIIILVYAYMGMILYGRLVHQEYITADINFESFGNAVQLVFIIATSEDWTNYMHDCQVEPPQCTFSNTYLNNCGWPTLSLFYFISLSMVTSFLLLNLFIAVLLNSFKATTDVIPLPITMLDIRNISALWSDPAVAKDVWLAMSVERFVTFLEILPAPFGLDRSGINQAIKPQDKELETFLPDCPVPVRAMSEAELNALDLHDTHSDEDDDEYEGGVAARKSAIEREKEREKEREREKAEKSKEKEETKDKEDTSKAPVEKSKDKSKASKTTAEVQASSDKTVLVVHYADALMGIAAMRFRRTFGPNFDPGSIDMTNSEFVALQKRYRRRFDLTKSNVVLPLTGMRAMFTIWGYWSLMKQFYAAGRDGVVVKPPVSSGTRRSAQRRLQDARQRKRYLRMRKAKQTAEDRLLMGLTNAPSSDDDDDEPAGTAAGKDEAAATAGGSSDAPESSPRSSRSGDSGEALTQGHDGLPGSSSGVQPTPVHNPSALLRGFFLNQLRTVDPQAATDLELVTISRDTEAYAEQRRQRLEDQARAMAERRAAERREKLAAAKAGAAEKEKRMGPQGAFLPRGSRREQQEKDASAQAAAQAAAAAPKPWVSPIPAGVQISSGREDIQSAFAHTLAMLKDEAIAPQDQAVALRAAAEAAAAEEEALANAQSGTKKKKKKSDKAGGKDKKKGGKKGEGEKEVVIDNDAELADSLAALGIASNSSLNVTAEEKTTARRMTRKHAAAPAWATSEQARGAPPVARSLESSTDPLPGVQLGQPGMGVLASLKAQHRGTAADVRRERRQVRLNLKGTPYEEEEDEDEDEGQGGAGEGGPDFHFG